MINNFFLYKNLEYTPPVRMIYIFGEIIQEVSDLQLVSPNGDPIDSTVEEVFAERLLNEENPWEALYELEVAELFHSKGVGVELIEEGNAGGPDLFICLCGSSIPIECKHRRPVARSIDSTDGRGGIAKRILDKIDIGDDSIFVELTGDGPLREDCTDQLVDIATDAIHSKTNMSTTIGGIGYEILIRDYYTGHRNLDLTKNRTRTALRIRQSQSHLRFYFSLQYNPDESWNVYTACVQDHT